MRRRAERIDETRRRIVEAAARLHTTVGPANTSIAGIAEQAGVTRLTVYRHFPELETLFEACEAHWSATHPAPDARAWRNVEGLEGRARRAFRELYGWYSKHGSELLPIERDVDTVPAGTRDRMRANLEAMTDALVGDVPRTGADRRRLRATAAHLLSVATWRSLAIDQGLGESAADLAADLLVAAGSGRPRST